MGRTLGRSGIKVSDIGFGCWAIGGPFTLGGRPDGWGEVDDAESTAAVSRALELGITFFDTADVYGAGHSETVLGRALAGRREDAVIATKFGYTFDAASRTVTGEDASPNYIRRACRASLRRLGADWIDLYQLHLGDLPAARADEAAATLEELADQGLIRAYGWSTDDPARAALFARGPHCAAVQHELNVLADTPRSGGASPGCRPSRRTCGRRSAGTVPSSKPTQNRTAGTGTDQMTGTKPGTRPATRANPCSLPGARSCPRIRRKDDAAVDRAAFHPLVGGDGLVATGSMITSNFSPARTSGSRDESTIWS